MRMYDIISKKRDGQMLTEEEIRYFVKGYVAQEIPDYQASALMMAIYLRGMDSRECADLTKAMAESGDMIDLSSINGIKVDKHSTGGVGDTTTIILAPLVASIGVPIAKMSGRGLGHTGGTIDKLESIPGFTPEIQNEQFIRLVNENKIAVVGQTGNLAPADKLLYSLRDVTATVDSIPLIASSIMSKKIAAGAEAIVLDVKTGSGAFMKELQDAEVLAQTMVEIGKHMGRQVSAIISDMNEPLGKAIGNSLEIREALEVLRGDGSKDLTELCLELGSHMALLGGVAKTKEEAWRQLEASISSGQALETFRTFIESQNGDGRIIDKPDRLPQASHIIELPSPYSGFISSMHAEKIGHAAMKLGAGRETKESVIDLAAGIMLHKKTGDYVKSGEALLTIHTNLPEYGQVNDQLLDAIVISNEKPISRPLIYKTIH
ncbi:pyrimidine-nucleoside phosphorylase [Aciduricibacillus chroicocephali]|uniref:Pyrimidine-nucleoside phosphorylase n=1 Tax=Aciduricibacillus chroicocephali TaxID=3054939 RepID=A0ABY9KYY8_9BACI|nr:pyrimidine-nucleoside phosphorylase [Bacillaceae bacterium 44XB]